MPADAEGTTTRYDEPLLELANMGARYRGASEGTLADLLSVLAGPDVGQFDSLRELFATEADRSALEAVLESFGRDRRVFEENLFKRYPGLFESQGAD